MARYSVKTKLDPEEVIKKAAAYFGGGFGLEIVEQDPCCVYFKGGGGHVSVTAGAVEGKKETMVTLETREWDYQVKQFMREIA